MHLQGFHIKSYSMSSCISFRFHWASGHLYKTTPLQTFKLQWSDLTWSIILDALDESSVAVSTYSIKFMVIKCIIILYYTYKVHHCLQEIQFIGALQLVINVLRAGVIMNAWQPRVKLLFLPPDNQSNTHPFHLKVLSAKMTFLCNLPKSFVQ